MILLDTSIGVSIEFAAAKTCYQKHNKHDPSNNNCHSDYDSITLVFLRLQVENFGIHKAGPILSCGIIIQKITSRYEIL